MQQSVVDEYTFNTLGEHVVKYTLADPTKINNYVFQNCAELTSVTIPNTVTSIGTQTFTQTGLKSIIIPNSVTTIGSSAFEKCRGLTSVTIGSGVTNINGYAFRYCSSINTIISLATTAPTISSITFQNVKTGGTLIVPSESTGYDVWMGTVNYYLGNYNWTKVEQ